MTKAKLPPGVRVRPDGRLEQRITLDGVRVSIYALTLKELKANVEKRRNEHAQGIVARTDETVESYLLRWLEEVIAPPHRAWLTYTQRRGHVIHHLAPALGHIRLSRLSTMDVRQALNAIHRSGLAARTVNHIRTTLTAALNDALREGEVVRNAAALVKPLPVADDTRQPLTADEARRFLAAVHDDRLGALCGWSRLWVATGGSDGPDVGCPRPHDRRTPRRARPAMADGRNMFLKSPKNRTSERLIVLPHAIRGLLAEHLRRQRREQEAVATWGNPWNLVFTSRTGKPLHETTVNTLLARHLSDAELLRQTFHMLRNACASLLAERGVPEIEVQALLGHASGKTTRRFYQHAYPSARQRVADMFDALLGTPSG